MLLTHNVSVTITIMVPGLRRTTKNEKVFENEKL
jgi:hypothetical protein